MFKKQRPKILHSVQEGAAALERHSLSQHGPSVDTRDESAPSNQGLPGNLPWWQDLIKDVMVGGSITTSQELNHLWFIKKRRLGELGDGDFPGMDSSRTNPSSSAHPLGPGPAVLWEGPAVICSASGKAFYCGYKLRTHREMLI